MTDMPTPASLTAKDFASDQEVRWCPGCGDYAILKAVQKTLADIGASRHRTVFVSGIGCSSRFPYYMSTFGFHTIHGRAPAVATGTKLANPELDVWVVTGDGDGMSIGANHLFHVLRRNVDLQVLLFNNEIYGLTKGQYSPTSRAGTRSPSSPKGSLEAPVNPCAFALGAGARFIARSADTLQAHLQTTLAAAHAHKGASFVEILQNCLIYNDGVFGAVTDKATGADNAILVEHGQPMVFGKNKDKGLRINIARLTLEVVTLGDGISENDLLVHDESNATLAGMLARLGGPQFPTVLGVIYRDPTLSYEARVQAARAPAKVDAMSAPAEVAALLRRSRTWAVRDRSRG